MYSRSVTKLAPPKFSPLEMFGGIKRSIINLKANDPHLSNCISEEKDCISGLNGVTKSTTSASRYIQLWGDGEHEDLKEITKVYTSMTSELTFILNEYTDSQTAFREKLKEIRTMYDEISATRQKLKSAAEKCQRAIKAGKPYEVLVADRDFLEKQVKEEVAAYESKKRILLQEGMTAQFNGILKFALKIPQFEVKPGEDLPAFQGRETTQQIFKDFQDALMRLPDLEFIESNHTYFQPEVIDSSNISQHYPGSDISPSADQLKTHHYPSINWTEDETPVKPPRNRSVEELNQSVQEVTIAPAADILDKTFENPW
ncbi:hypothetical protein HK103_005496 [Boothiomyces macroporosus]|uniref:Uncharacterized protein n=1 Tax=Boothiomyces macroporosus TaxID=261099 RepID=A0AAD5UI41_9FUNG|nr:hypothetical protein HK103_005496 [Boothiomyces macroporosus]